MSGVAETAERLDGAGTVGIPARGRRWRSGDIARLIGVDVDMPKQLRMLKGNLCTLQRRCAGGDRWVVLLQNKEMMVASEHLLACEYDDPDGIWAASFRGRRRLLAALVGTAFLLFEAELAVRRCRSPSHVGQLPGMRLMVLALLAPVLAFVWLLVTVAWCYALHEPIRDPAVAFPQISELGAGPRSARMLYRVGFGSAAVLFYAMVLLQQELCMPLLQAGSREEADVFVRCGLGVCLGIAMQGVFVLETGISWQTGLHLGGALLFFGASMNHMGAAQRLYYTSEEPDNGGAPQQQLLDSPLWDDSPLLRQVIWIRHNILMRAPMVVFVVPLLYQFCTRMGTSGTSAPSTPFQHGEIVEAHGLKATDLNGKQGTVAGMQGERVRVNFGATHGEKALAASHLKLVGTEASPAVKNLMGLAQWLLVLNFSIIYVSYTPELIVAATLPIPDRAEHIV